MTIRVQTEDFDAGAEIRALSRGNPKIGAVASFIGLVRDLGDSGAVSEMTLEHYPGMTEKALRKIAEEARQRWDIAATVIIHRVGLLRPADQIVLVAVASRHRREAFAACEFIIDALKTRAPFWKKECTPTGSQWVAAQEKDGYAAARWA